MSALPYSGSNLPMTGAEGGINTFFETYCKQFQKNFLICLNN